jgi:hypothetical protein
MVFIFYGNDNVDGWRLKKQMKGTKEMSRITLHPRSATETQPIWFRKNIFFERVCKGLGLFNHQ